MNHRDIVNGISSSDMFFLAEHEVCSTRRGLLLAPLLAALPLVLCGTVFAGRQHQPVGDPGYTSRRDQVERMDKGFPAGAVARWRRSTAAWTTPGLISC